MVHGGAGTGAIRMFPAGLRAAGDSSCAQYLVYRPTLKKSSRCIAALSSLFCLTMLEPLCYRVSSSRMLGRPRALPRAHWWWPSCCSGIPGAWAPGIGGTPTSGPPTASCRLGWIFAWTHWPCSETERERLWIYLLWINQVLMRFRAWSIGIGPLCSASGLHRKGSFLAIHFYLVRIVEYWVCAFDKKHWYKKLLSRVKE